MTRRLRSTTVYEALRQEIISGAMEPGERLAVRALSQRFDVSDIPVREALWMLERDGLVENTPYAGARLRTFTQREIADAYEVRGHLESLGLLLGTEHLLDEHLEVIDADLAALDAALDAEDLVAFGRLNRKFHESLLVGCPNKRLLHLIENLWDGQTSYQMVFRLNPGRASSSQCEHHAIVAAVKERDAERASRLLRDHRLHSVSALAQTVLTEDSENGSAVG